MSPVLLCAFVDSKIPALRKEKPIAGMMWKPNTWAKYSFAETRTTRVVTYQIKIGACTAVSRTAAAVPMMPNLMVNTTEKSRFNPVTIIEKAAVTLVFPVPNAVFAGTIVQAASRLLPAKKTRTSQLFSANSGPTHTLKICCENKIRNRKGGPLTATTYLEAFEYSFWRDSMFSLALSVLTKGKITPIRLAIPASNAVVTLRGTAK